MIGQIRPSATGTLSNTATVTAPGGYIDTNTTNNTAIDKDALTPTVDLAITTTDNVGASSVTSSSGASIPGDSQVYTVTVANTGPSNAVGVKVADPLAANGDLSSDSFTAVGTTGATGFKASGAGSIGDTVNLAADSSITYSVSTHLNPAATGTLSNTATLTAGAGETLAAGSITSATDTDTLTPNAQLTVSNSDNVGGSSSSNSTGRDSGRQDQVYGRLERQRSKQCRQRDPRRYPSRGAR